MQRPYAGLSLALFAASLFSGCAAMNTVRRVGDYGTVQASKMLPPATPVTQCFKKGGGLNHHSYRLDKTSLHRHYNDMVSGLTTTKSINYNFGGIKMDVVRGNEHKDAKGNVLGRSLDSFKISMGNCVKGKTCYGEGFVDGSCSFTSLRLGSHDIVPEETFFRRVSANFNDQMGIIEPDLFKARGCEEKDINQYSIQAKRN